jgi:hypothetical protein
MRSVVQLLVAGLFVVTAGCMRPEPHSAIVERAEKAGSGNLTGASPQAMQQWLGQHREVAIEIESLCKPVRESAPAEWNQTTEGRLCAASKELAFFRSAPARGDGRVFRPGVN